jgi:hypothetical protein
MFGKVNKVNKGNCRLWFVNGGQNFEKLISK